MADAATVNAIKDLTRAVEAQTRVLKEQNKILETMNGNYVKVQSRKDFDFEGVDLG